MEIPVYLFTGFLESGKTTFIQKTLSDARFNQGENTLLLLCEEGEVDYDPTAFSGSRVYVDCITDPEELTTQRLDVKCKKHACQRVVVEYNGMWSLDKLYQTMPLDWTVYQEFFFADAGTFLTYHQNMRELVVDKLRSCEMAVFNRATPETDKLSFHQIVRAYSRRCDIAYEDEKGAVTYDDIPDELPYDLNAPVVEVALEHYATWYRDVSEEMDKYQGKVVKLEGAVIHREDLPTGSFIIGREMMTCCADDLSFAGILCLWKDAKSLTQRDWVEVTAKISLQEHKIYGRRGPIFQVQQVTHCPEPANAVATFY